MTESTQLDLSNLLQAGAKAAGAVPAPVQAAAPEDNLDASFANIGGKKVRGASPKTAEAVEHNPDLFKSLGGKYVGRAAAQSADNETK